MGVTWVTDSTYLIMSSGECDYILCIFVLTVECLHGRLADERLRYSSPTLSQPCIALSVVFVRLSTYCIVCEIF
jgi:hypothetical protein